MKGLYRVLENTPEGLRESVLPRVTRTAILADAYNSADDAAAPIGGGCLWWRRCSIRPTLK